MKLNDAKSRSCWQLSWVCMPLHGHLKVSAQVGFKYTPTIMLGIESISTTSLAASLQFDVWCCDILWAQTRRAGLSSPVFVAITWSILSHDREFTSQRCCLSLVVWILIFFPVPSSTWSITFCDNFLALLWMSCMNWSNWRWWVCRWLFLSVSPKAATLARVTI